MSCIFFCASWRSLHVLSVSLNWRRVLDFGWGLAEIILEKGFLFIIDKNDYGMYFTKWLFTFMHCNLSTDWNSQFLKYTFRQVHIQYTIWLCNTFYTSFSINEWRHVTNVNFLGWWLTLVKRYLENVYIQTFNNDLLRARALIVKLEKPWITSTDNSVLSKNMINRR